MALRRVTAAVLLIVINTFYLAGCWNYREIDILAIVAGVAVDKGSSHKFDLTVEIVDLDEKNEGYKSQIITMEGDSIFEAARRIITVSGRRLYWSHAKVIIISRELAEEGVLEIMDWFSRDAETRADIHTLICRSGLARDVLNTQGVTEKVNSFELDEVTKGQNSLSIAPHIEIWEFSNDMRAKGIAPISAVVDMKKIGDSMIAQVMDSAIFDGDKLVGFINGEETTDILFVRDEIKGGALVIKYNTGERNHTVVLEIFINKTELKAEINPDGIVMNIKIKPHVAIDEIEGDIDVINGEGLKKFEKYAEELLANRITATIKKLQSEYSADVLGFGSKLKKSHPAVWKAVEDNWREEFKTLRTNVVVDMRIKNSAILSEPMGVNY